MSSLCQSMNSDMDTWSPWVQPCWWQQSHKERVKHWTVWGKSWKLLPQHFYIPNARRGWQRNIKREICTFLSLRKTSLPQKYKQLYRNELRQWSITNENSFNVVISQINQNHIIILFIILANIIKLMKCSVQLIRMWIGSHSGTFISTAKKETTSILTNNIL